MEIYIETSSKVETDLIKFAFRHFGIVKAQDDNRLWLLPHDLCHGDKFLDWLEDTDYRYELV